MSAIEKKSTQTYLEHLKQKALKQENYGGEIRKEEAKLEVRDCPKCGAGRAVKDGLTACAYCGFIFMEAKLTDGLYIKKGNNS